MNEPLRIAVIDDDLAVLDSLRLFFSRKEIRALCFDSAEEFLDALDQSSKFDCIVSDVRMHELSGLDLVNRLGARRCAAPIILITGHGDIDMAVAAIKAGAFDFIEKPFDENRLLVSIRNAVEANRQKAGDDAEIENLRMRFEQLSFRQRQIMELAASGLSSKEIGAQLKISSKTVENHRAWVMERIGARNLADLVRMAIQLKGSEQR